VTLWVYPTSLRYKTHEISV